jgi:hypothetical protein
VSILFYYEYDRLLLTDLFFRFLLPALQINYILEQTNENEIRSAIHSLPLDLTSTFDLTLDRIRHQSSKNRIRLAIDTLMWLVHVEEPITVDALCHAMVALPG